MRRDDPNSEAMAHTDAHLARPISTNGMKALYVFVTNSVLQWFRQMPRPSATDEMVRVNKSSTVLEIRPNYRKLVEVVLCILSAAERRGMKVTQFQIVKTAFFADLDMIETFGVPITFDIYKAMTHGPVGSAIYDLLDEKPDAIRKAGPIQWTRSGPPPRQGSCTFYGPKRPVDDDVLNPEEIHVIEAVFSEIAELSFDEISDRAHEHPAFQAAWAARGERSSHPMDYALLIPGANQERLEELAHLAQFDAHA